MPANQAFLAAIAQRPPLDILAQSLEAEPSAFIRINPSKISSPLELERVSQYLGERVPWCEYGYALTSRPRFTFDPAMHQGLYYVQDSSSMSICAAISAALRIIGDRRIRYLDLCAAPGGKTTAALSILPSDSVVAANEYDYKRAEILAENVSKWGIPRVVTTRGDSARYRKLPGFFNIVAVDAPCSGEGMMRKDAKAAEQWSMQLVRECASLQKEILDNAWTALAPGGCLIYSTCTFNTIENEDNVRYMIDTYEATPLEIHELSGSMGVKAGIDCDFPCYRFIPGHVPGEGQFIALLQKPYSSSAEKRAIKSAGKGRKGIQAPKTVPNWLKGEWRYWQIGDEAYGAPANVADDIILISDKTDALSPGLRIGTLKGRDLAPSQSLALCVSLDIDTFPMAELDYDAAIAYLQRQAPSIPSSPKGINLLSYNGHPLGFAKNLGNRANNLYPKEWRILT